MFIQIQILMNALKTLRLLWKAYCSDFCVFPPGEWADLPDADAMEVAVKVHQWITLTREHAQRAVEQWQKKVMQNFMGYFKMNQRPGCLGPFLRP